MPHVVVADQNLLNFAGTGLRQYMEDNPEHYVVLPDVTFVEMCKGERWEIALQVTADVLRGYRNRLAVSRSVHEMLGQELQEKKALTADKLFNEPEQGFLDLLVDVKGVQSKSFQIAAARISEMRRELEEDLLNPGIAKERAQWLMDTWFTGLKPAVLKILFSSKISQELFEGFIQAQADDLCHTIANTRMGLSLGEAQAFIERKPLILRYTLLMVRHSLMHAKNGKGSVSQIDAHKELNSQLDIEYALTASYINGGLVTEDKRAKEAAQALERMLSRPLADAMKSVEQLLTMADVVT